MLEIPDSPHGVHLRTSLTSLLGTKGLSKAIETGWLMPFSRTVLVEYDRAMGFTTRAAASLLTAGPDAALTRNSALVLHGCTAAEEAPIEVVVPYQRRLRRRPGLVVHHGLFEEQDVIELDGLRSVVLDTALAEMLCRAPRHVALACADQAFALQPEAARGEFRAWVEERITTRRDPRGRRRARFLLDLATGLPESPLESRTLLTLVDAGFPPPVPQFPVCDVDGREIYRLDLAWPDMRIAVEYDGYAAHANRRDRDAERDADLRRRGWLVIRTGAADLGDPTRLIAEVNAAFRRRGLAA